MASMRYDVVLAIVIILANIFVMFVIQKAQLKDKRYFLLTILSITDALQPTVVIFLIVFREELRTQQTTFEVLNISFFLHGMMSYLVTIMLTLDRFLAIRYCLKYYRIVTKQRILLAVLLSYFMTGLLVFALIKWTVIYERTIVKQTFGVIAMDVLLRFLTIVIVLTVGSAVNCIRKENIRKFNDQRQLFGRELEIITRLRTLKQSIDDVTVLNIWTVIFLTPRVLIGLIIVSYNVRMRIVDIVFRSLYLMSNPIIYLSSQTELRKWIASFFLCIKRRNNIHPSTPLQ